MADRGRCPNIESAPRADCPSRAPGQSRSVWSAGIRIHRATNLTEALHSGSAYRAEANGNRR